MGKNKLFCAVYAVLVIIFVISGTAFFFRTTALSKGKEFYQQLGKKTAVNSSKGTEEVEKYSENVCRLSEAAREYPNIAVWLKIPDTAVDYPVMLGEDNQFYLNHLPDCSKNLLGSLFLDYRTKNTSRHLIIYGHNGMGGQMFGGLKQYESPDYLQEHQKLILTAEGKEYHCPIFSVRRVSADGGAYILDFPNTESLMSYWKQAAAESIYPIEAEIDSIAGIVTLSTCTGQNDKRLIVQAFLPEIR